MPDNDATNAALINYAGQVASSSINAMAQTKLNKKTMRYNDEWAYRQREWALQDWNMQNEYNSPPEVRKRLIAANLNPALAYGKGPGDLTSGPIRAGASPNWSPSTPKFDLGAQSSLLTYLGVQKQTAEIDQMHIQNDLLREKLETQKGLTQLTWDKAALTQSQNAKIQMWIDGAKQYEENNLGNNVQGNQLGYVATTMHNQTQKQNADITMLLDENARREIYKANNTKMVTATIARIAEQNAKTEEEIKLIRENVKLLEKSNILQGYQIDGERFLKNLGPAAQLLRSVFGAYLGKK